VWHNFQCLFLFTLIRNTRFFPKVY
jgi:hypothetical protein